MSFLCVAHLFRDPKLDLSSHIIIRLGCFIAAIKNEDTIKM